jgi:hypothetical protein
VADISVVPSAGALVNRSAAIMPLAPGLFSTKTVPIGPPFSFSAIMRATMSWPPPGEEPTRMRVWAAWARAESGRAVSATAPPRKARRLIVFIQLLYRTNPRVPNDFAPAHD